MKRNNVIAGLMALMMGLTVAGCERLQDNMPTSASADNSSGIILVSPDGDASEVMTEASLQSSLLLSSPESDRKIRPMGGIFSRLSLSAEQDTTVRNLMKAQHDCVKAAMEALRASEKAIRQNADTQRKAIIEELTAGTIDTATAKARLKQLNSDTRTALQNNPARAEAKAAMDKCHEDFNAAVRAILTAEQQAIWDNILANGPADGKGKGPGGKGKGKGGDHGGKGKGKGGHGHSNDSTGTTN